MDFPGFPAAFFNAWLVRATILLAIFLGAAAIAAIASQEPPRSNNVVRMPPPAANATEGNVQDLSY